MKTKKELLFLIFLSFFLSGMPWVPEKLNYFASPLHAKNIRCSVCRKKIRSGRRFIKADGKIYCRKKCFNTTLPKCEKCNKPINRGYKKQEKLYCSKKCLATTYPKCNGCGQRQSRMVRIGGITGKMFCQSCAAKPRCFCCLYPEQKMKKYDDGRYICKKCFDSAVLDVGEAKLLMRKIRQKMKNKLNLSTPHKITLRMVSADSLKKRTPDHTHGREMGLYIHQEEYEKTTTKKYTLTQGVVTDENIKKINEKYFIYVLYGLTKEKLIEVIAHELGHDWMQAHYPNINDLKVKEGWAEYVAYLTNELFGNKALNKRIKNNQDPIYGSGFRKTWKASKEHGKHNYDMIIDSISQ